MAREGDLSDDILEKQEWGMRRCRGRIVALDFVGKKGYNI